MAFHPEKCNVLTITKKRNPIKFNYTLQGHSLEHVNSAKYLGCTITSDDLLVSTFADFSSFNTSW
jgi:type VI protein secretion system component VasF